MSSNESKTSSFLTAMIKEADAYTSMELIESYVEKGMSLENFPIQPLYLAIKNLPVEQASLYLAELSQEQRKIMLDLDLWEKDDLDVAEFEGWVRTYAYCDNEMIRSEFVNSSEFGLYLKGRFNIWTFDIEEPEYPDHDNYFLTEDNLLLFEFDEGHERIEDVQRLIRDLYSELGVEKAYASLFKYVNESYQILVEEEYRLTTNRLVDAGFVDYYEALKIENPHASLALMNNFIKKKTKMTGMIDDFGKSQRLDRSALIAYKKGLGPIDEQLLKVKDQKRKDFLQFNFIRLVNGTIALRSSLKEGSMALNRVGEKTRALLELGFDYLNEKALGEGLFSPAEDEGIFDYFDFCEIYRIGQTLVSIPKRKIKKILQNSGIKDNESFLGPLWDNFLDQFFTEPAHLVLEDGTAAPIKKYTDFLLVEKKIETLCELIPFIDKMHTVIQAMSNEGNLSDDFYLNYDIADLDFEAVILSSFANHYLGHFSDGQGAAGKMGLSLDEYKSFVKAMTTGSPSVLNEEVSRKALISFASSFGLSEVSEVEQYLLDILKAHLNDYEFESLRDEEFSHVGGPIILNTQMLN